MNRCNGCWSLPFTEILENMSKVTPKFVWQNDLISESDPGSCPPKLSDGNPSIMELLSLYFLNNAPNPLYWGVYPHCDATLTTRRTLPLCFLRETSLPSMSFAVKSSILCGGFSAAMVVLMI